MPFKWLMSVIQLAFSLKEGKNAPLHLDGEEIFEGLMVIINTCGIIVATL